MAKLRLCNFVIPSTFGYFYMRKEPWKLVWIIFCNFVIKFCEFFGTVMWPVIVFVFIAVLTWHVFYCNFSSKGRNINKFPGPIYIPLVGSMLVFGDMLSTKRLRVILQECIFWKEFYKFLDLFDHKKLKFPIGTSRIWLGFTPIIFTTDCDVIQVGGYWHKYANNLILIGKQ